jgi:2-polyprenyl-3-methyl-5-hydroxy-6-metoxy-1,4-benzoquinol methylase
MMRKKLFVLPRADVFTSGQHGSYAEKFGSYSHYNYLRPGLITGIKRSRFETALRAVRGSFGNSTVIDMGCADGVFLPSLSKHFRHVIGVDVDENSLATAADLILDLQLPNVRLLKSRGMTYDQIRAAAGPDLPADIAFLLETLEHIGTAGSRDVYVEKIDFLLGLFSLLRPDGRIVVSVPRMVGLGFLIKHATQAVLRLPTEHFSISETFRAGFLKETEALEPRWKNGHLGFNDEKLSRAIRRHFVVEREFTTVVTRFFVIRKNP